MAKKAKVVKVKSIEDRIWDSANKLRGNLTASEYQNVVLGLVFLKYISDCFEKQMIWLTRQQLADLFGRDYKNISKHINNALKEELADEVVVAKFANTTQHGAIEGKGYAINERIRKEQIGELRQLVGMLGRTIQNQPLLSDDETNALFEVVTDYTYALHTLVALTLMIAESRTEEKDVMVKVVVNLINQNN